MKYSGIEKHVSLEMKHANKEGNKANDVRFQFFSNVKCSILHR